MHKDLKFALTPMTSSSRCKMNYLPILALVAGGAIAVQATMNSQLGVLLNNSLMATSIAFLVSGVLALSAMVLSTKHYPQIGDLQSVPIFLWFSGGMLSAFGVGMFYYLIPKMGVGSMMSYALSGQIVIAIIASHFGWFNLPSKPIDSVKVCGAIALVIGVVLLNWEANNAH